MPESEKPSLYVLGSPAGVSKKEAWAALMRDFEETARNTAHVEIHLSRAGRGYAGKIDAPFKAETVFETDSVGEAAGESIDFVLRSFQQATGREIAPDGWVVTYPMTNPDDSEITCSFQLTLKPQQP